MNKPFKEPTEDEIDEIATAEADDDSAWEEPITVRRPKGGMSKPDEDQIAQPSTTNPNS